MFCCRNRKLVFVMATKTGTHTFSELLDSWGAEHVGNNAHIKLEEAAQYIPDIETYTAYGFFRDPLKRFLSCVRYLREGQFEHRALKKSFSELMQLDYDYFVDNFDWCNNAIPSYFDPQVKWLEKVNVLDFSNFNLEILKVARMFDVSRVHIPVLNYTKDSAEVPSQKVIDFVNSYYLDDYRFGHERGLVN